MKRVNLILAAVYAAFLLAGCFPREKMVTRPTDLGFEIENVTGTKVAFSIDPANKDAFYSFFCTSEGSPDFDLPEKDAAQNYLSMMEKLLEEPSGKQEHIADFTDFCCYQGKRKLKLNRLSNDTLFKLIVFQVNPKTHTVIGDVISERVRTREVPQKDITFDFSAEGELLTITPSDPEQTYFWGFDRQDRIKDDYGDPYFFLYSLLDMYEEYGFTDNVLSQGVVKFALPTHQLWEGETYCFCAFSYEDGEINSSESMAFFTWSRGNFIPIKE